jgi:CRP-like cAMP-binding protein
MIAIMFEAIRGRFPGSVPARRLVAGAYLFHRDDEVRSLFLVERGAVELCRHVADGKPAILQRAGPGAVLAEASVYSRRYHCDAVAADDSAVLEIPRSRFLRAIDDDAAFARNWMEHLARQAQAARQRAETLTLKTVAQRLNAWLAFHGGSLPPKGARMALARDIGVSPEALYREIARRSSRKT